nr:cholesterol 7-alpha-monooxygenase [Quercus suber]
MDEALLSTSVVPTAMLPSFIQGQTFFLLALALLLLSFIPYLPSSLLLAIATLLLTSLATRILTGRNTHSTFSPKGDGSRTVPLVPYWTPFLGHAPFMAYDATGFLRRLRETYTRGIFGLHFLGKTYHVVYAPELVDAVFEKDGVDGEEITRRRLINVFGFPTREIDKYDAAQAELTACYHAHLFPEGDLRAVSVAAENLERNLHDFVTGSESMVDQTQWERASRAEVGKDSRGAKVVEASLFPLVRDFTAHVATPSLMGSDFLENYPNFFDELWTLNQGFWLLAAGLPRWTPIPSLTRAHIARRNLLRMLSAFHAAMEKEADGKDPGPEWQYLESVQGLVRARLLVYRKHGFSIAARAAIELSLLRAANTKSNALIFWMVTRIYADKALLELIREEIAPYMHAVQAKKEFEFVDELPVFDKWDVESLIANCPLLSSCYVECLRLDTVSWSFRIAKQDLTLQANAKDAQAWSIKKGEYVLAAHSLHSTDPAYFKDPFEWRGDRHVKILGDGSADLRRADAVVSSAGSYGKFSSSFFHVKMLIQV